MLRCWQAWFDQTDGSIPGVVGLTFKRSYNSLSAGAGISGSFGSGWSHSYERDLIFPPATPKIIKLREDNGNVIYFEDENADLLSKPSFRRQRPARSSRLAIHTHATSAPADPRCMTHRAA
jgi:hypothetical protein